MSKTFPIIVVLLCGLLLVSGCAPLKTPSAKPPPPPSGPPDPLTDVVVKADLIALGTITDLRYQVVTVGEGEGVGKSIYTIFTLTIEKVIKGDPDTKEVFIRVAGGVADGVAQTPTGMWYFSKTDRVLVGLGNREDGNLFLSPNVLWMESSATGAKSTVGLQEVVGSVIGIMEDNNIPVALPEGERPPRLRPAPTPVSPPKR